MVRNYNKTLMIKFDVPWTYDLCLFYTIFLFVNEISIADFFAKQSPCIRVHHTIVMYGCHCSCIKKCDLNLFQTPILCYANLLEHPKLTTKAIGC